MSHSDQARVSIITPAYNAERLIGRTIESVLAQSYSSWELIVVDDCSKDGTCTVVEEYAAKDARIKLVKLNRNYGGPAGPRNEGIRQSRGEWVSFLDADDIWHPQKLALQLSTLEETGAVFACSSMQDFVSEEEIQFHEVAGFSWEHVSFRQQSLRARIPTSSVIASRELLLRHPFFDAMSYKAVEDYHCWLRLLKEVGECVKLKVPLLLYRKIDGQISGSKLYMMGRVFMVHRNFPGRSLLSAATLTLAHVIGGLYFRFIKKGM